MEKYRTIRVIGKGSYGEAVLVRKIHGEPGKHYVMKRIKVTSHDRQVAMREGRLLSALDHPNIIGYKESFMVGRNQLCIITDYADGGDLQSLIDRQKAKRVYHRSPYLSEEKILDLFVQLCLAIKHVHDRKILHRDIKSPNIFLTKQSVVKLGDFGIAKVLKTTMECAATAIGTPYYLSPEICQERKYNHKSDIWSLGCVLYELVTLKHAFEGRNMKLLVKNIVQGTFRPIPTHYSRGLRDLISQMLSKNPKERPSINAILRNAVVKDRIKTFLSNATIQKEFSHTVLHGENVFGQQNRKASGTPTASCDSTNRRHSNEHARAAVTPRVAKNNVRRASSPNNVVKKDNDPYDRRNRARKYAEQKRLHALRKKREVNADKPAEKTPSEKKIPEAINKRKASVPVQKQRVRETKAVEDKIVTKDVGKDNVAKEEKSNIEITAKSAEERRKVSDFVKEKQKPRIDPPARARRRRKSPVGIVNRVADFNSKWEEQREKLLYNVNDQQHHKVLENFADNIKQRKSEMILNKEEQKGKNVKDKRDAQRLQMREGIKEKRKALKNFESDSNTLSSENIEQHQLSVPVDASTNSIEHTTAMNKNSVTPLPPAAPTFVVMETSTEKPTSDFGTATTPTFVAADNTSISSDSSNVTFEVHDVPSSSFLHSGSEKVPKAEDLTPPSTHTIQKEIESLVLLNDDDEKAPHDTNLEYERMVIQLKSVMSSASMDSDAASSSSSSEEETSSWDNLDEGVQNEIEDTISSSSNSSANSLTELATFAAALEKHSEESVKEDLAALPTLRFLQLLETEPFQSAIGYIKNTSSSGEVISPAVLGLLLKDFDSPLHQDMIIRLVNAVTVE